MGMVPIKSRYKVIYWDNSNLKRGGIVYKPAFGPLLQRDHKTPFMVLDFKWGSLLLIAHLKTL
jgi:hypothetical protein